MPKKDISKITPDDIVNPSLPDEMPSMTKAEIRVARNKIQTNRAKKLHILAERKIGAIKKIGEDYYVNTEMLRNEEELARQIKGLEEAIRAGNKDQVKIKKNILTAKTKMEEVLNHLEKEKDKILEEFKEKRAEINVIDSQWNQIRSAQRERSRDGLRATAHEVDELSMVFDALKKEVTGYRLDRHLVARVENLQTEIEVLKQQNQKIFQILKTGGLGR